MKYRRRSINGMTIGGAGDISSREEECVRQCKEKELIECVSFHKIANRSSIPSNVRVSGHINLGIFQGNIDLNISL